MKKTIFIQNGFRRRGPWRPYLEDHPVTVYLLNGEWNTLTQLWFLLYSVWVIQYDDGLTVYLSQFIILWVILKVVGPQSTRYAEVLSVLHYSSVTKMWHWHDFPHLSLVKTNCSIDDVIAIAAKSDCTVIEYKYGAIFSSMVIAVALDSRDITKSAISKAITRAQNANKAVFACMSIFLVDFFFCPRYLEFIFANYSKNYSFNLWDFYFC